MKIHWATRTLLAAAFFASLAWAIEESKSAAENEVSGDVSSIDYQNVDTSEPEQKIISIGNVGECPRGDVGLFFLTPLKGWRVSDAVESLLRRGLVVCMTQVDVVLSVCMSMCMYAWAVYVYVR